MKFELRFSDIKLLIHIFQKFPQIREVKIFGSRAIGNSKKGSDIDIVLKGKITDRLISKIRSKLEDTPLPYFFDVLDYKGISNNNLKEHIDKYGEVLYAKKNERRK